MGGNKGKRPWSVGLDSILANTFFSIKNFQSFRYLVCYQVQVHDEVKHISLTPI